MPTRNAHWYSRNEGISYPLDDAATMADDADVLLPNNIITDLMLRWPNIYGDYAFISSVTVTDRVVSVTILSAPAIDTEDSFSPLAVVTVPMPVVEGRMIAFQGQVEGVGGWIVFGRGVATGYRGRFSSPTQSRLTARAARAYRTIPVTGLRALDAAAPLRGIVNLKAQAPLVLAKETREIEGVLRDCVVVRLDEGGATGDFPIPEEATRITGVRTQSVFQEFSGPCAGRPESRTCGDPEPIEFINAVGPNCEGVLTLEFEGCAIAGQIQDVCGVILDCGMGMIDACLPPQIPDAEGRLPSEYDPVTIPPPDDEVVPPTSASDSESLVVIGELPLVECFVDADADDFVVQGGLWEVILNTLGNPFSPCEISASDSDPGINRPEYVYAARTAAFRNVATWNGFDETTLQRKLTIQFRLVDGPTGTRFNAGAVLNYRPHTTVDDQFVYYLAEMEYETQTFRIMRYNGTSMQTVVTANQPGILLDTWYEIECIIRQVGTRASIEATLRSLENGAIDVTIGPLTVSNYTPSTGQFGLHANRALTEFGSFVVEEFV